MVIDLEVKLDEFGHTIEVHCVSCGKQHKRKCPIWKRAGLKHMTFKCICGTRTIIDVVVGINK